MPGITVADNHIDKALSQISIGWKNSGYIADTIFPMVPVDFMSDKYYEWDKENWFRNRVERRAPAAEYPRGLLKLSNDSYQAEMYHLGYDIPDERVKNEDDALNERVTGSEWLADQFMLNRELVLKTTIFTTSIWGTDVTGGTNFTKWDDFADSNPEKDIRTAKQVVQKNTGLIPNTLVLGQEVMDMLVEHPQIVAKYQFVGVGILTAEQVAAALKVDRVVVGSSIQNSADEAETDTFTGAYIWGKNALLMYVTPAPGIRVATAGYQFVWNIQEQGTGAEDGITVGIREVREESKDNTLLKGKQAFDPKIVASECGYFLATVMD